MMIMIELITPTINSNYTMLVVTVMVITAVTNGYGVSLSRSSRKLIEFKASLSEYNQCNQSF